MTQYIPKEPLVAEIDRIVKEETEMFNEQCQGGYEPSPSPAVVCMRMEKLRSFLNTLAVKEVDLEKEYKDFIKSDNGRSMFETAEHFFELGMQASNKTQKGEEV